LAYALQFSLPGTPVLRYGEEIGMGEDLSLDERLAIRTPMQWSDAANAGFSSAAEKDLVRPVIDDGEYAFDNVNVDVQRHDKDSLLSWFERMLRVLRECPESGEGEWTLLDPGLEHVLAVRFDAPTGTLVTITNLADEACTVDLSADVGEPEHVLEVFGNRRYETHPSDMSALELDGWGYRWVRLASA
jgi:maltose alpha-D-glucosyltransferase/alpha-amylase